MKKINDFLDWISEFLAQRKGLLPILGAVFVIINGVIQFIPGLGFIQEGNIFLHLGVLLAIIGFLIAWAL
jgi:hypothetical protein